MRKRKGTSPIVWACEALPALLYIVPLATFQYHYLFEVRLAKGQKEEISVDISYVLGGVDLEALP